MAGSFPQGNNLNRALKNPALLYNVHVIVKIMCYHIKELKGCYWEYEDSGTYELCSNL